MTIDRNVKESEKERKGLLDMCKLGYIYRCMLLLQEPRIEIKIGTAVSRSVKGKSKYCNLVGRKRGEARGVGGLLQRIDMRVKGSITV